MMYDHIIEMIIHLFKWYDELDNEGDRFFLSKEECDADVEIYRRYGYRPIGKKIQYIKVDYELPSPGILLAYMSCWFMEATGSYRRRGYHLFVDIEKNTGYA